MERFRILDVGSLSLDELDAVVSWQARLGNAVWEESRVVMKAELEDSDDDIIIVEPVLKVTAQGRVPSLLFQLVDLANNPINTVSLHQLSQLTVPLLKQDENGEEEQEETQAQMGGYESPVCGLVLCQH